MTPGTDTTSRIEDVFGKSVIAADGSVDRARLARQVFADHESLRRLESIVHPAVRRAIRGRLDSLDGEDGVVVIDAVRLLQSDLLSLVEQVWVVTCSRETQLQRLTTMRGMTSEDAERRLLAQPSFDHPRVSRVIENSGSQEDLRRRAKAAWESFLGA